MNDETLSTPTAAERRIANHLQSQAPTLSVGNTSIGDVISRGKQRRIRRRTAVGALTAAAVSVATIVTINALSQPSESGRITNAATPLDTTVPDSTGSVNAEAPVSAQPTPVGQPGVAALIPIPSNLVWNRVTPDSTEALGGTAFGVTPSGTPYIAVSSAPGQKADDGWDATLYRSDDGIAWTQLENFPDVPLTAFDAYGGSMYAFSTAAATAPIAPGGGGEVVIESSSDEGVTWQTQILPLDLRGLADSFGVQYVPFDWRSIAAGPIGTIAIGDVSVTLDLVELGLTKEGAYDYIESYTDDGIIVRTDHCGVSETTAPGAGGLRSASSCSTSDTAPDTGPLDSSMVESALHTWAELGVDQAVVDAILAPPHAFVKAAGAAEFVETPFPTLPDGFSVSSASALATSDGYAVSAALNDNDTGEALTKLYRSSDGVSWVESDIPLTWVNSFGQLPDGSFVAVGQAGPSGGTASAVSADGTNWTIVELDGLLTEADGVSARLNAYPVTIGSSGVTISANIWTDPFIELGPISISKDGVTITQIDSDGNLVFTDESTGDEIGRLEMCCSGAESVNARRGDTTGLTDLLNADGSVRLTVTDDDNNRLYQQVEGSFTRETALLHSDDGIMWSREDLGAIAGFDVAHATRIQSTGNQVLVTVLNPADLTDLGVSRTIVLVGTPKT